MTAERLLLDLFPVEVYAPGASSTPFQRARVFVTDQRVQVWIERQLDEPAGYQRRQPELLLDEPLGGAPPQRDRSTLRGQLHLQGLTGPVHVTNARGCGCGSPLKALSPPVAW